MELQEACAFLNNLINASVVILNSPDAIKQYCDSNHFHSVQKNLTPDGIQRLLKRLNGDNIVVYRDALRMHMTFLTADGQPIVVGPYCTEEITAPAVELLNLNSRV